jgi:two-component system nitrate/nitrite response regulator NarL
MTSIVLGDGHALVAECLGNALERHGMRVLRATHELRDVIDAVRNLRPDVCLLDDDFGHQQNGGAAAVRSAGPDTKLIMLAADGGRAGIASALASGADGYVHRSRGCGDVVNAVHAVLAGEVVVDVPPARAAAAPLDGHRGTRRLASYLTERERQCLALLVDGQPTEGISASLGVSRTTVRSHIQAVMSKLGVHSRLEAAALAVRHGLVPADAPALADRPCG